MPELKPVKCSCGGEVVRCEPDGSNIANGDDRGSVWCRKCGLCVSCEEDLHGEAVEKWNQLQGHNALRARIRKLEETLKEISISGRIRNNDKQFQKRIETIIEEALRKLTTVNENQMVSGGWVAKIAREALESAGGK